MSKNVHALMPSPADAWHARLVRYYSFFGFQPVAVVEGSRLADLPHMLVCGHAWGSITWPDALLGTGYVVRSSTHLRLMLCLACCHSGVGRCRDSHGRRHASHVAEVDPCFEASS